MTSDRLMVWKFEEAPPHLADRCSGVIRPLWLVLIPASIYGPDIDDAIRTQSTLSDVCRYQTENRDVIYVGSSRLDALLGRCLQTHPEGGFREQFRPSEAHLQA